MNSSMRKNVLWNTVGNLIYLGCQWLVTVLVTVLAGFEDAGILSLAMSVSVTFQTVALFGVRNFQVSDIDNKYSDTTYFNFRLVCSLTALLSCLIFSLVTGYTGKQLIAIMLYMLYRLAESISDVIHGIAQKRDRLDVAGKSFALKGILTILSFFLGYKLTGQLNAALAAMAISSFLSTVLFDYVMARRIASFRPIENIRHSIPLLCEVYPLCIYTFLYSALYNSPKLILELLMGEEVLGIYASIFAPATLLLAATSYIYNPFATVFAESLKRRDFQAFRRLTLKISVVMLIISAAVVGLAALLGEFALVLIFGESIRAHVYLLIPIIIVTVVLSYVGFVSLIATILRDFLGLILGCGVGFASVIALSVLFINLMGPQGTSIALIISGIIAMAIILLSSFLKLSKIEKADRI